MLVVYKGYEKEFLEREKDKRLVDTEIENKSYGGNYTKLYKTYERRLVDNI